MESQHPGQNHGLKPPRRRISGASEVSTTEGQRSASPRPLAYQKMRTGKCWFEKGNFDHLRMCFGCFRAHFGPGGSLKQPQHVKKVRCALENAGLKKGDFDHFRMGFGCFRAHFGPGGSLKQPQRVKKVKNDSDQKDAHWKMQV